MNWKLLATVVLLFVASLSSATFAQEKYREPTSSDGALKWKFAKGASFKSVMTQSFNMKMDLGVQKMDQSNKTTTDTIITIDDVDPKGNSSQSVTIERMQMDMNGAGGKVQFDSSSKEELSEQEQQIADSVSPMINKKILQKVASDGSISDIQIPEDMIPESDPSNPASQMFNKKSFEEMQKASAFKLPRESMKIGETWTESKEINMGPMKIGVDTKYEYKGIDQSSGKPLHVFGINLEMKFPDSMQGVAIEVVKQDAKGAYYFDGNEGRLVKTELHQEFTLEMDAGGQTIEQNVVQDVTNEFSPVEKK